MPGRKKIAVIVPKYGLVGGAEHFAAETTNRLAESTGHEFHVFAHLWNAPASSPVVFHRIPGLQFPRSLRPWAFALHVKRALAREHFEIVHSHERVLHADVVSLHCTPHRTWIREIRKKNLSLFDQATAAVERRLLRNGAQTIFLPVSSSAMAMFRSEYQNLPGTWRVMHPGVEFAKFSAPNRSECRAEIRTRHGFSSESLLVLFVGMNFELKGLDTIMESVAETRKQHPEVDACLLVIGKGDEQKYRSKARALGIEKSVSFAGTVREKIERYYRASDALMMLSGFDTFGMVVLEAMAAGLPVIIGPKVGARDIIENGTNGFVLHQNRDTTLAADSLSKLCDPKTRFQLSAAAQTTAATRDWNALTREISDLYKEILCR
jgi:UDP-glucose:(heptosyl)LPS alpha-1,3-glucosyltransferase